MGQSWWVGIEGETFRDQQRLAEKRMRVQDLPEGVRSILDSTLELEARELLGLETPRTRSLRKIVRGAH